ncbi:TetR/AcrR family transcriptional regulator [Nocardia sp. CDC159]|uniref:TetR/AcrR family transcriptional regulator n=1 Tax=Nocardia pulmonis TaxID=2951408 RepID=A0A9X2E715_9NOCA|nr:MULTISPECIES: TetR/AcrR family transcriptional regulator [Nocardia]MCM6774015.1 TetR/AcrR family transcriptional regulator [Nocardia pulmonis]MCM6786902.1 TetR/AcrR family transcriptional regulator [Nocardia sp. CDC159]
MVDPASLLGFVPDGLGTLDPTARKIVTAARICFTDSGFADTTMQRIADAAGVGVATVYRRFGHKQQLVRLAIMDEALRVATLLAEVADHTTSPEDTIVEVFTTFVHAASAPKLLTRSIRESPAAGELSAFLTNEAAIAVARMLVTAHLDRWQTSGELSADLDTAVLGEMIARLMMSLVETPESVIPVQNVDRARDFARSYLVPLVQTWRTQPFTARRPAPG